MKTDELLTLQALKFKQSLTGGVNSKLAEHVIENTPQLKEKLRNICAFISPELFDDIESLCGVLDLSKRQFVEMALVDLVEKAKGTLHTLDALPEA